MLDQIGDFRGFQGLYRISLRKASRGARRAAVRFDGPKRTAGVRRITEGGGMLILSRLALFSNRHKKRRDPNGDDRASRFDIFCPDGSVIRLTAIEARANEGIVRIGIEAPAEYRIVRADAKTQEKQEKQEKGDAIDDRDSCGCDERVA